jgi:hypothetical protein
MARPGRSVIRRTELYRKRLSSCKDIFFPFMRCMTFRAQQGGPAQTAL